MLLRQQDKAQLKAKQAANMTVKSWVFALELTEVLLVLEVGSNQMKMKIKLRLISTNG